MLRRSARRPEWMRGVARSCARVRPVSDILVQPHQTASVRAALGCGVLRLLCSRLQEGLRLLEVRGIEAFGETPVDVDERAARLIAPPLGDERRARLEAARNSNDRACCWRAMAMARRKHSSAAGTSAGGAARRSSPLSRWSSGSHKSSPVARASASALSMTRSPSSGWPASKQARARREGSTAQSVHCPSRGLRARADVSHGGGSLAALSADPPVEGCCDRLPPRVPQFGSHGDHGATRVLARRRLLAAGHENTSPSVGHHDALGLSQLLGEPQGAKALLKSARRVAENPERAARMGRRRHKRPLSELVALLPASAGSSRGPPPQLQKTVFNRAFDFYIQFKHDVASERTKAGLARARAEGKTFGRPKIGTEIEEAIRQQLKKGTGFRRPGSS